MFFGRKKTTEENKKKEKKEDKKKKEEKPLIKESNSTPINYNPPKKPAVIQPSSTIQVKTATTNANKINSTVEIYINLDENVKTDNTGTWTHTPAANNSAVAKFYLNKILRAGQTSEKLIDSVELSDVTPANAFTELTFDLNVGLKSAQITYDNDNVVTTDATAVLDATPTVGAKISDGENGETTYAVSWANAGSGSGSSSDPDPVDPGAGG